MKVPQYVNDFEHHENVPMFCPDPFDVDVVETVTLTESGEPRVLQPISNARHVTLRERLAARAKNLPLPRMHIGESQRPHSKLPQIYDRVVGRLFSRRPRERPLPPLPATLPRHDCVICQSPIADIEIHAPCGHYLDPQCLVALVEASTGNQLQFPPRCCQRPIPFTQFEPYLSPSLAALYSEKEAEFSTRRRVYCANPVCSRFLGPRTRGPSFRIISCPSRCGTLTCNCCRAAVSNSEPAAHRCRHDRRERAVLALASRKKWARCPACEQVIELHSGCYHMTCLCGQQFCYLCGAPWKTCACVQWEVVQLRDVGEHLDVGPEVRHRASGRGRNERADVLWEAPRPVVCDDRLRPCPEVVRIASEKRPAPEFVENDPETWDASLVDDDVVIRGLLAQHRRRKRRRVNTQDENVYMASVSGGHYE
ncbi:hypothetical protein BKA93DRAFT_824529 [Sparassis latifolia]|uniref:RBR-type E3 ubiquitin transferase n=1 Tax=Sparassis crispa TaxID=139825 RepID=A0A401GZ88_9APHY|nr:hypothetical protein SCP_1101540 [Sparassis crispa]GBE87478.1 hypothetical protein SCP_1101540 [Sparassis crispa]